MASPREATAPVAEGKVVAGRFQVVRLLGTGGMAEVFEAKDLATKKSVALKLLKEEVSSQAEAVERVRREGEVLRTLTHPAIVGVETFGQNDDGRIFIVMELLEGETLGEKLRRDKTLSLPELSQIVTGTCAGLAAAHERDIVHRDLKPDNIFLSKVEGGFQVKLLDFGIAKVTGSDKLTNTGEVLGTPRYMAPEQLSAERDLDGRTDIYALGVILFEALAGRPPYLAANPTDLIVAIIKGKHAPLRSYRPGIPAAVEAVVARAMARAREARYATALELAEAWVDVALAAPSAEAKGPRDGASTAFLGSLGERGAAPADDDEEAALRPGTFSELAQVPASADADAEDPRGFHATVPARISAMPDEPKAPPKTRASDPAPPMEPPTASAPDPEEPRPSPAARSSGSSPGRRRDASHPVMLDVPTSDPNADAYDPSYPAGLRRGPSNSTKLILIGLLAGALSAIIAIAALSYYGKQARQEEAAQQAASEGAESAASASPEDDEVVVDAGTPGGGAATPGGGAATP